MKNKLQVNMLEGSIVKNLLIFDLVSDNSDNAGSVYIVSFFRQSGQMP